MFVSRGYSSHMLDSSLSEQSEEPALAEGSSRRHYQQGEDPAPAFMHHDAKRRRIQTSFAAHEGYQATVSEECPAGEGALADATLMLSAATGSGASGSGGGFTAASLCCAEAHDFLEDADSSMEPEEGFTVYQSPLSLAPPGACGAGPPAGVRMPAARCPLVPARHQHPQQQLACDPDLEEMLSVLRDSEAELQPSATYLDQHGPRACPDLYLDASMRMTAASWLVEVAAEFGLHQETLFLAAALLDRFLSAAKGVPRTQLQLVGVACMLIAAKHEEEMHPSVLDFTNIADNCFLPADLLRMEAIILDCLSFRINTPTAHTFLSLYKQALLLQPRTCALASYLAELAMLEYELLHLPPSHIASAATLLAQLYTGDSQGIGHLPSLTGYTVDVLKPCMRRLLGLQHKAHAISDFASPYLAVRDKYRGHQWFCVATTTPFPKLPTAMLPSGGGEGGDAATTTKPAACE